MNAMPVQLQSSLLELVRRARKGDHDAFGQLIAEHQTLIVSIAYGICGDFARSEDIAQEAFVAAWRQLGQLDHEARFKAWLCGIARNLARNAIRQQGRRPDRVGETPPIEPPDEGAGPREHAVSREEATVVWQSLQKLPENYREPLILFYRQQQSIERVAAALDLTADTVKQRLARGRALLRADIERTIERSLGFTTPGALFTLSVVSAVSGAAGNAALMGPGASAVSAKTGMGAKAALLWPTLAAPFIALVALWLGYREALRGTRTEAQRRVLKRMSLATGAVVVGGNVVMATMLWRLHAIRGPARDHLDRWLIGWLALDVAAIVALSIWYYKPFVEWARSFEMPADISPLRKRLAFVPQRHLAYRTRAALFGWPLLDIRFGLSADEPLVRGTARGWIALGDRAHGIVFALGGVATGAIAVGVVSVGALSIGGLGLGGIACDWVAVGWIAHGAVAFGYMAFGVFAGIGFEAAQGLIAIARHFAYGMFYGSAEHLHDMALVTWSETNRWARLFRAPLHGPVLTPLTALLIPILSAVGTNWLVRTNRPGRPPR